MQRHTHKNRGFVLTQNLGDWLEKWKTRRPYTQATGILHCQSHQHIKYIKELYNTAHHLGQHLKQNWTRLWELNGFYLCKEKNKCIDCWLIRIWKPLGVTESNYCNVGLGWGLECVHVKLRSGPKWEPMGSSWGYLGAVHTLWGHQLPHGAHQRLFQ